MIRRHALWPVGVAALGLLAVLASRPAAASPWPDLEIGAGGTFAVSGEPGDGGFALRLAGMWPVEGPLAFGVQLYGDDMGTTLAQYQDAGNPYVSLGTYQQNHRWVYGAAWRIDAVAPVKLRWQPFATGTWCYARVQDDQYGVVTEAQSAAGFTLGLGVRRPVQQNHSLGLVAQYHRLLNDRVSRYMSVALEWGWHFGSRP